MSNIPEQLRLESRLAEWFTSQLMCDAAREIEELREKVVELRKALRPFANAYLRTLNDFPEVWPPDVDGPGVYYEYYEQAYDMWSRSEDEDEETNN